MDLGGELGDYRLLAWQTPKGHTIVSGLPSADVRETVDRLLTLVVGGALVGVVAAGVGGVWLVRRNLAPLQRMAHTATRVALKLDSGDVALAERVPDADTDERTEVGQVGRRSTGCWTTSTAPCRPGTRASAMRQFVADASHELRTPRVHPGYAELSRREREPVPPRSPMPSPGSSPRPCACRPSSRTCCCSPASTPAGPRAVPSMCRCWRSDVVSDAHAAAPDHQWRLDLPDEPVEVRGDTHRLHQVVANLLANARTHTFGDDGHDLGQRVGDWVRIAVHDNGPGVPPALQSRVFERFTRGDDSRNRSGGSTRPGPEHRDAVAHAHGGRVELASAPATRRSRCSCRPERRPDVLPVLPAAPVRAPGYVGRVARPCASASSCLRSSPVGWPELLSMARTAEAVGLDSLWLGDHLLYDLPGGITRGPWEVWTSLAAIAAVTERIEHRPARRLHRLP